MPDYTFCHNDKCEDANTCARFLGVPSPYWQSYTNPYEKNGKDCLLFWDVEDEPPFELMKYSEALDRLKTRGV